MMAIMDWHCWKSGTTMDVTSDDAGTPEVIFLYPMSDPQRDRMPDPIEHPLATRRLGWPYQTAPEIRPMPPRRIGRVRLQKAPPRMVRQHRDSYAGRAGTVRCWKAKNRT